MNQLNSFFSKADEELKKDKKKWKGRLRGFLEWQIDRRGESEALSLQKLVAAALAKIEWQQEVIELLNKYDRLRHFVLEYKYIYQQVRNKDGYLPIYSGYYRIINRRYQAMHFWPPSVTSKHDLQMMEDELWPDVQEDDEIKEGEMRPIMQEEEEKEIKSYRKRWFKAKDPETEEGICDLVGLDISSSHTQIIAKLLCIEDLERLTEEVSFKVAMAKMLWERSKETQLLKEDLDETKNYKGPEDPRLQNLCKYLWMRVSYGGNTREAVKCQQSDPTSFGPGWINVKVADQFLKECLYEKYPAIKTFLDICRRVAEIAYQENPCSGVIFTDPYDSEKVRWNPVARDYVTMSSSGFKLILSLPGKKIKPVSKISNQSSDHLKEKFSNDVLENLIRIENKPFRGEKNSFNSPKAVIKELNSKYTNNFRENKPAENEEHKLCYPVDRAKLRRMVAPCLVHMLDAYYSSLVMDKLIERKITPFVAIHDCWLVPEKVIRDSKTKRGIEELNEVLDEAAFEWYKGLKRVYKEIEDYLIRGRDKKNGEVLLHKQNSKKRGKRRIEGLENEIKNFNGYIEFISNAFKKWKIRDKNNYRPTFRVDKE